MRGDFVNLQRNSKIEAASLDQELLLFDPAVNKFYLMNATAAFLWEALATSCDEGVLTEAVCRNFSAISKDAVLVDVRESLQNMVQLQLVLPETWMDTDKLSAAQNENSESREPYVRPAIRVMDEKEVLDAFQVTVAALTWWGM
jgi:hypothetical protein